MNRKRIPESEGALFVEIETAKNSLTQRISDGYDILKFGMANYNNMDEAAKRYQKWNSYNSTLLKGMVSTDIYEDYDSGIYASSVSWGPEDPYEIMTEFKERVEDKINRLEIILEKLPILKSIKTASPIKHAGNSFVHETRIKDLEQVKKFDSSKLVKFCNELNIAHKNGCELSIGILTRAIIDHIAPAFGHRTFSEVANNYSGGKSFKEISQRLEGSSRKIADDILHSPLKAKENLPTITRVDFSNDLDLILGEAIKLMK